MKRMKLTVALRSALYTLMRLTCTFFACLGPDQPERNMVTCCRCYAIHDIREALGWSRWRGWKLDQSQEVTDQQYERAWKRAERRSV